MNKTEHYLTIAAEECTEVGQRISKALRFGLTEIQPGQPLTNAERIVVEAKDLLIILTELRVMGVIPAFHPTLEEASAKLSRVEKMFEVSRREGTLQDG